MARKARYTKALPVYVTPQTRHELDEISEKYEISLAEVIRVLIQVGKDVVSPNTWEAYVED